jgi:hypothetical protein
MNLNGAWEFEFDDADVGAKENWPSGTHKFSKSITVPYCFESSSAASASRVPSVCLVPPRPYAAADWRAKRVLLFSRGGLQERVWVNGVHRGGIGAADPFAWMSQTCWAGRNSIVVRAGPAGDRYVPLRQAVLGAESSASGTRGRASGNRLAGSGRVQFPGEGEHHSLE